MFTKRISNIVKNKNTILQHILFHHTKFVLTIVLYYKYVNINKNKLRSTFSKELLNSLIFISTKHDLISNTNHNIKKKMSSSLNLSLPVLIFCFIILIIMACGKCNVSVFPKQLWRLV